MKIFLEALDPFNPQEEHDRELITRILASPPNQPTTADVVDLARLLTGRYTKGGPAFRAELILLAQRAGFDGLADLQAAARAIWARPEGYRPTSDQDGLEVGSGADVQASGS